MLGQLVGFCGFYAVATGAVDLVSGEGVPKKVLSRMGIGLALVGVGALLLKLGI